MAIPGGALYAATTGQLGEPQALTGPTGTLAWSGYAQPFGTTATFAAPAVGLDLGYPGQWSQPEAGNLIRNGVRDYDPSLGRYTEPDPLGIDAGQNPYSYVDGDPVNEVDSLGLIILPEGNADTVNAAIAYLSRDPGMRKIIKGLESSSVIYRIESTPYADTAEYDFETNVITWNPYAAQRLLCGGSQSPALVLGHEFAHAASPIGSFLTAIPWPGFRNAEEHRVITGPEAEAARTLGETPRATDAPTQSYPVNSPISRVPR